METFSALLALCTRIHWSLAPSTKACNEEPWFFFVVSFNKLLSKHAIYLEFETPWHSCNVTVILWKVLSLHIIIMYRSHLFSLWPLLMVINHYYYFPRTINIRPNLHFPHMGWLCPYFCLVRYTCIHIWFISGPNCSVHGRLHGSSLWGWAVIDHIMTIQGASSGDRKLWKRGIKFLAV